LAASTHNLCEKQEKIRSISSPPGKSGNRIDLISVLKRFLTEKKIKIFCFSPQAELPRANRIVFHYNLLWWNFSRELYKLVSNRLQVELPRLADIGPFGNAGSTFADFDPE
jgi:hypothetical protein